jgi:hypothetical protein
MAVGVPVASKACKRVVLKMRAWIWREEFRPLGVLVGGRPPALIVPGERKAVQVSGRDHGATTLVGRHC